MVRKNIIKNEIKKYKLCKKCMKNKSKLERDFHKFKVELYCSAFNEGYARGRNICSKCKSNSLFLYNNLCSKCLRKNPEGLGDF